MKTLKIAVSRACPECFTTSRDIVDITASDYIDVAAVVLAVSDIFNGAIEEIEATGFGIPVFIATHKEERVPAEFLSRIHGVFEYSDTSNAYYGRQLEAAAQKYETQLRPPFFRALVDYIQQGNSAFDCPGHQGGQFFRRHPAGNQFVDFFGETLFRADLCNADVAMGDLLIHEGAPCIAQQHAAKVFNADKTYFVLNGTSSSNKVVLNALLTPGDLVLFDRNNHKSNHHGALLQAGATPVYLETARNPYGFIGGIDAHCFDESYLRELVSEVAPGRARDERPFRLAVIQLGTYDGTIYNARQVVDKIGHLCDYILFDSAWVGYEQFIPMMADCSPLLLELNENDPGILVTQSVHKQQAGFSQTSQIHKKDSHIKGEKRCLPDDILDSAFLMNISTSPYYPLFAGLEMNALIHRKYGKELWEEAFRFSIHLRKKLLKNLRFIRPFLPPIVHGRKWEEADDKEIMNDPAFFSISKDYAWHGFSHAEDGLSMIDPCKILLTSGSLKEYKEGIPAPLISMYLESKGITPEKSDFCTILFLAEPGDKEGKAKRLVSALADLEKAFEENRPVSEILPECSSLPEEDIRDLSSRFFHFLHEKNVFSLLNTLFSSEHFPDAPMTGRKANQLWLSGKGEKCPLAEAEGRTALEAVLPYPPGICLLAAGETWTKDILSYFLFLEEYGREFPSFMPEVVGLHKQDGKPYVWVLSKDRG